MTEGGPSLRVRAARSIAFGAGFAVVAALALLVALRLASPAPPIWPCSTPCNRVFAALCVAGGSLLVALAAALIGRALIGGGVERLTTAVRTSAVVALAPQALRFGLRNAKLIGLASTAAATYFALRSARRTD